MPDTIDFVAESAIDFKPELDFQPEAKAKTLPQFLAEPPAEVSFPSFPKIPAAAPKSIVENVDFGEFDEVLKSAGEPSFWNKLRDTKLARGFLGATEEERMAMLPSGGGTQGLGLIDIAKAMLKFTTPPPPVAQEIRTMTEPQISQLAQVSPVAAGVAQGVREAAVNLPIAPLSAAPKTVLTAFSAEYVANLPKAKEAYERAKAEGNLQEAASIATETVLGGAMLIGAGVHSAKGIIEQTREAGASLTATAVERVLPAKEPVITEPAPPPKEAPVAAGEVKPAVVEEIKPEGWTDERWEIFKKQRQAAIDAQAERNKQFIPPTETPAPAPQPAITPEPAVVQPAPLRIEALGLSETELSLNNLKTLKARNPQQWEQVSKYFGAKSAPEVAKLAAARFEQMRTSPPLSSPAVTPAAPEQRPLGIVAPQTTRFTLALQSLANLPEETKLGLRGFAQQTLPRITEASRETGEAGARYGAATMVGRDMGYQFAEDVLGNSGINDRAFGVALKEGDLRGIKQNFQEQAAKARAEGNTEGAEMYDDAANAVVTMIGAKNSPFRTENEYQSFINDPVVREAAARHEQLWVEQKEPLYREAADIDPETELAPRNPDLNTRINLTHADERTKKPIKAVGTGQPVRQLATLIRRDPFARRATGTGQNYEGSYRETMAQAFEREYPVAKQHEFIKSLVDSGTANITNKAYEPDLKIKGEDASEGFALKLRPWAGQFIHLPKSLVPEYRAVTGLEGGARIRGFTPAAQFLTRQAIQGLGEGTAHAANILMKTFTGLGPTSRPMVNALLKSLGRVDLLYSIPRVIIRGIAANRADMIELGKIGAAKEPYQGAISSRLLNPLDKGVRLVSADIYKGMAENGIVPNTETGLREFVNEVGNYNKKTQSWLVRNLRSTQVQPFATGFRTAFVQSVRRAGFGPGVKATTPANAAALRADIIGGYIGFITTVATLNMILSGKPSGPPGTSLGAVGWIGDDKKTHQLDVGSLTGFTRGQRALGVLPFVESKMRGLDTGTALKQSARAMATPIVSQFAGPAVRAGSMAITGKTPYGTQEAPVKPPTENVFNTQMAANIETAIQQINPVVDAVVRKFKGDPTGDIAQRQLSRWYPRTVSGVQSSPRFAKIVTRANLIEYADGLASEARKLPRIERLKFIQARLKSDEVAAKYRETVVTEIKRKGVLKYK